MRETPNKLASSTTANVCVTEAQIVLDQDTLHPVKSKKYGTTKAKVQ